MAQMIMQLLCHLVKVVFQMARTVLARAQLSCSRLYQAIIGEGMFAAHRCCFPVDCVVICEFVKFFVCFLGMREAFPLLVPVIAQDMAPAAVASHSLEQTDFLLMLRYVSGELCLIYLNPLLAAIIFCYIGPPGCIDKLFWWTH